MTDKGMSFSFSYTYYSRKKTHKALQNLDKKKRQKDDVPVKIIKSHNDIFSYIIHHNLNNSLSGSIFPSEMKKG